MGQKQRGTIATIGNFGYKYKHSKIPATSLGEAWWNCFFQRRFVVLVLH
jgi:hypothetical protein